jgi:hypothetical protein
LQVLGCFQAPALHFIARQNALSNGIHVARAVCRLARALPAYQKTGHLQIVFCRGFQILWKTRQITQFRGPEVGLRHNRVTR